MATKKDKGLSDLEEINKKIMSSKDIPEIERHAWETIAYPALSMFDAWTRKGYNEQRYDINSKGPAEFSLGKDSPVSKFLDANEHLVPYGKGIALALDWWDRTVAKAEVVRREQTKKRPEPPKPEPKKSWFGKRNDNVISIDDLPTFREEMEETENPLEDTHVSDVDHTLRNVMIYALVETIRKDILAYYELPDTPPKKTKRKETK